MAEITPYDTGVRLEPKAWVRRALGRHYTGKGPATRDSIEDDFGKVDFDNDESATQITVWAEVDPDTGKLTVHIDKMDPDDQPIEIVVDDRTFGEI